jgi:hypothetical protein
MKDKFCSYYTNSVPITSYMTARLEIQENDVILEPSAGEGTFVDAVLDRNIPVHIDALEIDNNAIRALKAKYGSHTDIVIRKTDTLFDKLLDRFHAEGGYYTKIIGNPPYGAWQDYEKREILKKKYTGHYVKETYSLFLLRCISVLQMNGRLCFIIPDTFLFLNMHIRLREVLLTNTKINEILIFPSKFFPGVGFGYSNLSIITLERCNPAEAVENTIRIIQGFHSSAEFQYAFDEEERFPAHIQIYKMKQKDILKGSQCRFALAKSQYADLLCMKKTTLGDIADVVTGFYTGDNKRFIRVLNSKIKGAKGYTSVNEEQIYECLSTEGIQNVAEGYIPYIKSASGQRYLHERDTWFVRWDCDTVSHYHNDKKARFQNSSFYFKTGIGIPMVKSRYIRAFLMENRVFDQSVVGIFPKDSHYVFYILALMNADVINDLVHIINPTANNSANYIKQIPFIEPPQDILRTIHLLVKEILFLLKWGNTNQANKLHQEVNQTICDLYTSKAPVAGP